MMMTKVMMTINIYIYITLLNKQNHTEFVLSSKKEKKLLIIMCIMGK